MKLKNAIAAILLTLLTASAAMAVDTTTTRLGLTKPAVGSTGWGVKWNTNADSIDSLVGVLGAGNTWTATSTFTVTQNFSSMTVNNQMVVYDKPIFGIGPVTSSTAGWTGSGGTLTAGTYYYKIFPFTSAGKVGSPSPELVCVAGTSAGRCGMSWTATPGVSYYRIQRGTDSGGGSGYFTVAASLTQFDDTGQAFSSGSGAIGNANNEWITVPGVIDFDASLGGIRWRDWTTGAVTGHISVTSAGEFEMSTGLFYPAYYFENGLFQNYLTFFPTMNPAPRMLFTNNSFGTAGYGIIDGQPLTIDNNGQEVWNFGFSSNTTRNRIVIISTAAANIRNQCQVPFTSGNPYMNWASNADNFSTGLYNAGHAYTITASSNVDTGPFALKVSTNGFSTRPAQPYFHVRYTGTATNVTGDGTQYTMTWPTEITDNGSNFAQVNSTYCFTAPVTGIYGFTARVDFGAMGAAHTTYRIDLVTTSRTYTNYVDASVNTATDRGVEVNAPVASMTAGDIAYVTVKVSNGTKVVSVGSGSGDINYFMGELKD